MRTSSTMGLLLRRRTALTRRAASTAASASASATTPPTRADSTSYTYPGESRGFKPAARRVLVTGSSGQVGQELVPYLREAYGAENVIASDVKPPSPHALNRAMRTGGSGEQFVYVDVVDADNLARVVLENGIDTIVHLAAMLSAVGERNPQMALRVNMRGTENVLEVARQQGAAVFMPSTIAVFGPSTPAVDTPDDTIMRPTTMYGVSKIANELLGEYYHRKYQLDFRSLRYPGIISSKTLPGGGTTDWSVEIFYEAVRKGKYTCFVKEDTRMPMMYMKDTLRATKDLMDAPAEKLKRRVYNITAMSFTPKELAESIRRVIPNFEISYEPDFRQSIADSWPRSLDDTKAKEDWGWAPSYDLDSMCKEMLDAIAKKVSRS